MDLALEVGQANLGAFARSLPERDFRSWMAYNRRRGLPSRRLELYLAQIALMVMRAAGAENLLLSDFLFDEKDSDADALPPNGEEDELQDVMDALEFKPRKTKGLTDGE